VVTETSCLSANLVRHPAVTLSRYVLYRLGDVGRQSIAGTRLQQQPDHCQLQHQQPATYHNHSSPAAHQTTICSAVTTRHEIRFTTPLLWRAGVTAKTSNFNPTWFCFWVTTSGKLFTHTHASITKQYWYNLVPVTCKRCPISGKVTVGLVLHWACITDLTEVFLLYAVLMPP